MSVRRITAVLDSKETTGNDRVCLLVLADKANDAGYCWPGVTTIQEQMNTTRQTTLNAIKRLEDMGLIYSQRVQRRGSKYLVLPGLTNDQVIAALKTYFGMSDETANTTRDLLVEKQNKSKNHTSKTRDKAHEMNAAKKSKIKTRKVYNLDQKSLKHRLDPSIPVNEPSSAPVGADAEGAELPKCVSQEPPHSDEPKPRTEFQQLQDVLVELWFDGNTAQYGRAGKLAHMLMGTSKVKGFREYNLKRPITARELRQFATDYRKSTSAGIDLPASPETLNRHVYSWQKKRMAEIKQAMTVTGPTAAQLAEAALYGGAS